MARETALSRYEDLLLGKHLHFYLSGSDKEKEQDALAIIRYIVNDLLHWTPKEAMECMTPYIASRMHMEKLMTYITLPIGVSEEDYDYAVHLAFPDETRYDVERKVIEHYKQLINGTKTKFPKNYFSKASGGIFRARVLLVYAIATNLSVEEGDMLELFRIFADTTQANKLLKDWKLLNTCRTLYNRSPLKYLYDSIEHTPEVELLYNNFFFNSVFQLVEREIPKDLNT